ncbi:MAG: hypothetical protein LC620_02315, partial [Halobacteriales archaeon]|nr:hypothetical protein [Halobacteriales archaeon]
ADLLDLVRASDLSGYGQVWMPAAIGDYAGKPAKEKIASGKRSLDLHLEPTSKVIADVRRKAPQALLVAFKAESDPKRLLRQARDRLKVHKAQFVVANLTDSFGSPRTTAHLVGPKSATRFSGDKATVLAAIVAEVAKSSAARKGPPKGRK